MLNKRPGSCKIETCVIQPWVFEPRPVTVLPILNGQACFRWRGKSRLLAVVISSRRLKSEHIEYLQTHSSASPRHPKFGKKRAIPVRLTGSCKNPQHHPGQLPRSGSSATLFMTVRIRHVPTRDRRTRGQQAVAPPCATRSTAPLDVLLPITQ